jgi:hypothetical protein
MKLHLDWSAYDSYGAGDAYAHLPASGGSFGKAAAVCIGNRQCQRTAKGVMCPSYRATLDTAHSTQARGAALRAALNGEYGPAPFAGPELQAAMALCVGCKGCKRECPNGVDMALLRVEALAQHWTHTGRPPLRARLFAHLPRWIGARALVEALVRLRARVPPIARLVERWIGIAARRSLPRPARRSFLSTTVTPATADSISSSRSGMGVVLFIDTFSNHFDPDNAQAAVDVLSAAGYRSRIARAPAGERPLCCGRTYFSQGMIEHARNEALRTVASLAPYAERGVPIVGLEPSCLLMLRDEYQVLGLGPHVEAIAKSALLLEEFLAREHDGKRLALPLQPLPFTRALVHGHCHQKAFGAIKAMRKVLGLVPQLKVELIEASCCGMAGSFGMEAEHYDVSMQMAELGLLPAVRQAGAADIVIANGTSCRHQIRDGAQREGVHLARVLQAALASKPV